MLNKYYGIELRKLGKVNLVLLIDFIMFLIEFIVLIMLDVDVSFVICVLFLVIKESFLFLVLFIL